MDYDEYQQFQRDRESVERVLAKDASLAAKARELGMTTESLAAQLKPWRRLGQKLAPQDPDEFALGIIQEILKRK